MRILKHQYFPKDTPMAVTLPEELRNPGILQMNRLPARATVVPSTKRGVTYQNREQSDRLMLLNGDFRFALFTDSVPDGFETPGFDDADWDLLDVPSMWQYRGYSEPTYPNVEYSFPFYPPLVLLVNPIGCYRRTFQWRNDPALPRTILHFEGVDNAFYVYLNGEFVGFSKGSRLPAEFDVTELLRDGENLLAVKVYTYSDSSYLEDQDMLLASGIFRDLYLLRMPECGLWDYSVETDLTTLYCEAELSEPVSAQARFTLDGEEKAVDFVDGRAAVEFRPENVRLWTAETPNLYDFTLEILKDGEVAEVHSKRVGFRTTETVGREFRINGVPILVKGINRHENDPDNGRAITIAQIRRDLELIKSNNINSIRCAHYPNNPAFYEICSELGLYVMDEADLETHGCCVTGDQGFLNKCDEWLPAFLDRVQRTVARDKNETCIVIWSVGNECGSGTNTAACITWLRALPHPKPVNYRNYGSFNMIGYPDLHKMRRYAEINAGDPRPLFLVEYAHAMGNSPGNLLHLWDEVIRNPMYIGGYVWEFRSHGLRRRAADGTSDYLYGGDFHDDNHWSNFTLDGYLTSDSTPKPTFEELKYVFTPARLAYADGVLTVHNTRDFLGLSDLTLKAEVLCDARLTAAFEIPLPEVAPKEKKTVPVALPGYCGNDCFLTLRLMKGSEQVGLSQFPLPAVGPARPVLEPAADGLAVEVCADGITVRGEGVEYEFANGVPVRCVRDGRVWFDEPMRFVAYRAETDNDGIVGLYPRWIAEWEKARLHKLRFFSTGMDAVTTDGGVEIRAEGVLTADHCYTGFRISARYTVDRSGLLRVCLEVRPYGDMPVRHDNGSMGDQPMTARLPRFGVCFALPRELESARWYGRGPAQNYTDSFVHAPVGLYELPVGEMNFAFDVPQETGTRSEVRFAQISDGTAAFSVYGNHAFSFQLHPWALDNLRAARHPSELVTADRNYLYIDYRMRALGSLSCGPDPEREDDFEPHDFRFVFALDAEPVSAALPRFAGVDLGPATAALSAPYHRIPPAEERNEVECRQQG